MTACSPTNQTALDVAIEPISVLCLQHQLHCGLQCSYTTLPKLVRFVSTSHWRLRLSRPWKVRHLRSNNSECKLSIQRIHAWIYGTALSIVFIVLLNWNN